MLFLPERAEVQTLNAVQIMPEIMPEERPFYWACGKCRSRGIYRDDDFAVGDFAIACPMCGNRYYGDIGSGTQARTKGVAPVKVYHTPRPAPPPTGPGHYTLERTANILTGPWRSTARSMEKTEESMAKTGPCANCKRILSIIGEGCCFVCYKAGKGLVGEAKDIARAAIKAKIEAGGLRRSGRSGKGRGKPNKPWRPAPLPDDLPDDGLIPDPGEKSGAAGRTARRFVLGEASVPDGVLLIKVDFSDDRDRKIYDAVIAMARRLRREPEQQILWMLQNAIK